MVSKVHRRGISINTALLASQKRREYPVPNNIPGLQKNVFFEDRAIENLKGNNKNYKSSHDNTSSSFKQRLRPLVRAIFHKIKPFIHPPIFRLRKYFIEGIRQEIIYDLQQNIESSHERLKHSIEALASEIAKNNQNAAAIDNEKQITQTRQIEESLEKLKNELIFAQQDSLGEISLIKETTENALKEATKENQELAKTTARELQEQHASVSSKLDRIEQYSYATARRVTINCESGEILVKTEAGFVLCAANDYALLTCLIEAGDLELGTRLLIQEYLAPGDTYIDIGANIGMHTLAAARAMQGKGKIIAFEPYGPTKAMLEKSVWINGFSDMVEIHQAAVSNVTGQQALYLGETSGHHSLFELEGSQESSKPAVEVLLLRLDETIQATSKVDLLKIDVEGAELEVLESAKTLIENNKDIALIVEFGPSHLKRTGHTPEKWLAEFEQLGLVYQAIHPTTGVLESWTIEQLRTVDSINLFWSRPDSNAWGRLTK